MAFFYYRQNNSRGEMHNNMDVGSWVIVEHVDAQQANEFVQECTNGRVYFNGCEIGKDCRCCGDRWSPVNKSGIYESGENEQKLFLPYRCNFSMEKNIEEKYHLIEDVLEKEIEISCGPMYNDSVIHVYLRDGGHRMYSCVRTETGRYIFSRQM